MAKSTKKERRRWLLRGLCSQRTTSTVPLALAPLVSRRTATTPCVPACDGGGDVWSRTEAMKA
eukprot:1061753-Prymnesium_polylepis.2